MTRIRLRISIILLGVLATVIGTQAGPIGHAPYRGNAAPGMMNRGPEAGYFNRARPPEPLINPYRSEGERYLRPFVEEEAPCDQACADAAAAFDAKNRADAARVWCESYPSHWKCVPNGQPPEATVQAPDRLVVHNGSLMRMVDTPDGYVDIVYVRPRPGLPVLPGVLLLRGQWTGPAPQNLVAVAFVFPPYPCKPVPYGVRGTVDQGNTLVLFGPAPIVAPGCQVVGHDWTRNSELRFVQAQR